MITRLAVFALFHVVPVHSDDKCKSALQ